MKARFYSDANERLLTYEEVCAVMQISQSTLRRYVRSGRFPAPIKMRSQSRAVRFRLQDVRDWLDCL